MDWSLSNMISGEMAVLCVIVCIVIVLQLIDNGSDWSFCEAKAEPRERAIEIRFLWVSNNKASLMAYYQQDIGFKFTLCGLEIPRDRINRIPGAFRTDEKCPAMCRMISVCSWTTAACKGVRPCLSRAMANFWNLSSVKLIHKSQRTQTLDFMRLFNFSKSPSFIDLWIPSIFS